MADNLTPEQRRRAMSRMRSKDTKPELTIRRLVHARGLRYRKHVSSLPGTPDLAFPSSRVAVFVDGDFFHGWRFPRWKQRLSSYWQEKIERNRQRDKRNFSKLRKNGWVVIRIWQHQVKANPELCVDRIEGALRRLRGGGTGRTGRVSNSIEGKDSGGR